jgi:hypothetical protein
MEAMRTIDFMTRSERGLSAAFIWIPQLPTSSTLVRSKPVSTQPHVRQGKVTTWEMVVEPGGLGNTNQKWKNKIFT